jgi:hypothetical protein
MNKVTAEQLATILYEEFDRSRWDDHVNPEWLLFVAEGPGEIDDEAGNGDALRKVLERVAARLNAREE